MRDATAAGSEPPAARSTDTNVQSIRPRRGPILSAPRYGVVAVTSRAHDPEWNAYPELSQ